MLQGYARSLGLLAALAGSGRASLYSQAPQGRAPQSRWILIYGGAPARHKAYPRYTIDDLTRLVAVVDTVGRPTSWLTTGAIFIELYAPSANVFTDWIGGTPATGADWREYLDTLFAPGGPVARLDSTVGIVSAAVGPIGSYHVAIMIPYPDNRVDTLRYDGKLYSLRKAEDGAALAQAYTADVIAKFRAGSYRHLALDAMYWLHESISGADTSVVPAVAARVHSAGLRFLWIPYFTSPGSFSWRKFGFDETWMQPNYFFTPALPATRVDSAIAIARRLGMGTELEFDDRLLTSPEYADRLTPYLSRLAAAPDLRMRAVAIYEGHGGLLALSRSGDPWHRAMYQHLVRVLQSVDSVTTP
jgi:hypothetical protein